MELNTAIETRTTVRKFSSETVPVSDLKEMVKAAGLAPSVNNSQPWKFIAVTNKKMIGKISNLVRDKVQNTLADRPQNIQKTVEYFSTLFENAPVVIFVASESYNAIADKGAEEAHAALNEMRQYPDIQSIGAAVENILLSAVDLGLGACWLSGLMIAREEIENTLDIEQPLQIVTAVAIGKVKGEPQKRDRKSLDEIFQLVD